MGQYQDAYRASLTDPDSFWGSAADGVTWMSPPKKVLDKSDAPFYRWFTGGSLNTCFNAVDRHVLAGHGKRNAVLYESPITGVSAAITYDELLAQVKQAAGAFAALGVGKGDRVVIYMPMIPEALVAMLACARLGAVHSVVFGGFAPAELAARIDDAQPSLIVTASCGIEPNRILEYKPLVDKAMELAAHKVSCVVVKQRPQVTAQMSARDHDWDQALANAMPADCVEVAATDPLYVLYTSGTTGKPKGIVRDNGGHAVVLTWSMPNIYDINPGEVWWAASDVGWVVGHSYIVYAPLLVGATTIVFEGKPVGTPDAGTFWRIVEKHKVAGLFTAPTAMRAIKKEDPDGDWIKKSNISSLRNLYLAGERLDPDTFHWASEKVGVPVIDNWWQTETGWPIAANLRGLEPLPLKPGSPSVAVPGYDVRVVDERGEPVEPNTDGNIVIKLPLPPGTLPTLWNDDRRYVDSYLSVFQGYYATGDGGQIDEDGYIYVMGRTDDVINVAGHRLSTGSMEAVVASHPAVAECAVIGVADQLKGQVPRAFVVLKAGMSIDADTLQKEVVAKVREEIGAVAALKDVAVVPALPKTRSGKILRRTMRGIADGKSEPIPSTIEDPNILAALTPLLRPNV